MALPSLDDWIAQRRFRGPRTETQASLERLRQATEALSSREDPYPVQTAGAGTYESIFHAPEFIRRPAREFSEWITTPELDDSSLEASIKGFIGGGAQGAAEEFSPFQVLTTLLGFGPFAKAGKAAYRAGKLGLQAARSVRGVAQAAATVGAGPLAAESLAHLKDVAEHYDEVGQPGEAMTPGQQLGLAAGQAGSALLGAVAPFFHVPAPPATFRGQIQSRPVGRHSMYPQTREYTPYRYQEMGRDWPLDARPVGPNAARYPGGPPVAGIGTTATGPPDIDLNQPPPPPEPPPLPPPHGPRLPPWGGLEMPPSPLGGGPGRPPFNPRGPVFPGGLQDEVSGPPPTGRPLPPPGRPSAPDTALQDEAMQAFMQGDVARGLELSAEARNRQWFDENWFQLPPQVEPPAAPELPAPIKLAKPVTINIAGVAERVVGLKYVDADNVALEQANGKQQVVPITLAEQILGQPLTRPTMPRVPDRFDIYPPDQREAMRARVAEIEAMLFPEQGQQGIEFQGPLVGDRRPTKEQALDALRRLLAEARATIPQELEPPLAEPSQGPLPLPAPEALPPRTFTPPAGPLTTVLQRPGAARGVEPLGTQAAPAGEVPPSPPVPRPVRPALHEIEGMLQGRERPSSITELERIIRPSGDEAAWQATLGEARAAGFTGDEADLRQLWEHRRAANLDWREVQGEAETGPGDPTALFRAIAKHGGIGRDDAFQGEIDRLWEHSPQQKPRAVSQKPRVSKKTGELIKGKPYTRAPQGSLGGVRGVLSNTKGAKTIDGIREAIAQEPGFEYVADMTTADFINMLEDALAPSAGGKRIRDPYQFGEGWWRDAMDDAGQPASPDADTFEFGEAPGALVPQQPWPEAPSYQVLDRMTDGELSALIEGINQRWDAALVSEDLTATIPDDWKNVHFLANEVLRAREQGHAVEVPVGPQPTTIAPKPTDIVTAPIRPELPADLGELVGVPPPDGLTVVGQPGEFEGFVPPLETPDQWPPAPDLSVLDAMSVADLDRLGLASERMWHEALNRDWQYPEDWKRFHHAIFNTIKSKEADALRRRPQAPPPAPADLGELVGVPPPEAPAAGGTLANPESRYAGDTIEGLRPQVLEEQAGRLQVVEALKDELTRRQGTPKGKKLLDEIKQLEDIIEGTFAEFEDAFGYEARQALEAELRGGAAPAAPMVVPPRQEGAGAIAAPKPPGEVLDVEGLEGPVGKITGVEKPPPPAPPLKAGEAMPPPPPPPGGGGDRSPLWRGMRAAAERELGAGEIGTFSQAELKELSDRLGVGFGELRRLVVAGELDPGRPEVQAALDAIASTREAARPAMKEAVNGEFLAPPDKDYVFIRLPSREFADAHPELKAALRKAGYEYKHGHQAWFKNARDLSPEQLEAEAAELLGGVKSAVEAPANDIWKVLGNRGPESGLRDKFRALVTEMHPDDLVAGTSGQKAVRGAGLTWTQVEGEILKVAQGKPSRYEDVVRELARREAEAPPPPPAGALEPKLNVEGTAGQKVNEFGEVEPKLFTTDEVAPLNKTDVYNVKDYEELWGKAFETALTNQNPAIRKQAKQSLDAIQRVLLDHIENVSDDTLKRLVRGQLKQPDLERVLAEQARREGKAPPRAPAVADLFEAGQVEPKTTAPPQNLGELLSGEAAKPVAPAKPVLEVPPAEGATTMQQLPPNVRSFLQRQLGYSPDDINGMTVDEAMQIGRDRVPKQQPPAAEPEAPVEAPSSPPAPTTRPVAAGGATTTPGTRLAWRTGQEWAAAWQELQSRKHSAQRYAQEDAHLRALAENPEWIRQQTPEDLQAIKAVIESREVKPVRGQRAGTPYEKVLNEVNNALALPEQKALARRQRVESEPLPPRAPQSGGSRALPAGGGQKPQSLEELLTGYLEDVAPGKVATAAERMKAARAKAAAERLPVKQTYRGGGEGPAAEPLEVPAREAKPYQAKTIKDVDALKAQGVKPEAYEAQLEAEAPGKGELRKRLAERPEEALTEKERELRGLPPVKRGELEGATKHKDALHKGGLTRANAKRAYAMQRLIEDGSPQSLDEYARALSEQIERENEQAFKWGTSEKQEGRKKWGDEFTRLKPDKETGEYVGFMGSDFLQRLHAQNPALFWQYAGGLVTATVGAIEDPDHWERWLAAGAGIAIGPGALRRLAPVLRKAVPKAFAEVQRLRQEWNDGPEKYQFQVRRARDMAKDIPRTQMWRSIAAVEPDLFRAIMKMSHEANKEVRAGATPEMRKTLAGLHHKAIVAKVRDHAKAAAKKGHKREALYLTRYAEVLAGVPVKVAQIVADTVQTVGADKITAKHVEQMFREINKQVYRTTLGVAQGSALVNRTQSLFAYPRLGFKSLAAGMKKARTPEGKKAVQDAGLIYDVFRESYDQKPSAELIEALDKIALGMFRWADEAARGDVYNGAVHYARVKGHPEIAERFALDLTTQTQGLPGELAGNPFIHQYMPGRALANFATLYLEMLADYATHPDKRVARRAVGMLTGAAALTYITGVNLLSVLWPRISMFGPITGISPTEEMKHVGQYLGGEAPDHRFRDDLVNAFVPWSARKTWSTIQARLPESMGGYGEGLKTRPTLDRKGWDSDTRTPFEDVINLLGFESTRQLENRIDRGKQWLWSQRERTESKLSSQEAQRKLRDAIERNDQEDVLKYENMLTPGQLRSFYRQAFRQPRERLERGLSKEQRERFRQRFGESGAERNQ